MRRASCRALEAGGAAQYRLEVIGTARLRRPPSVCPAFTGCACLRARATGRLSFPARAEDPRWARDRAARTSAAVRVLSDLDVERSSPLVEAAVFDEAAHPARADGPAMGETITPGRTLARGRPQKLSGSSRGWSTRSAPGPGTYRASLPAGSRQELDARQ